MAHFSICTIIDAPAHVVFDVSRSIDGHLGSMARSRERAVAGVTSGLIGPGEQVTWRATHFGIPFTMTSKIVEMNAPSCFTDEQVHGPFRSFRHEHRFNACGDGTAMIDEVRFTAPLGPIGRSVERLVLTRYMRKLIVQRNQYLKNAAEQAGGAT